MPQAPTAPYPRDMIGYGPTPPDPCWPDAARLALSFVVNYEEGGENSVLHGDAGSETYLSEIVGAGAVTGSREPTIESLYEYGSRVGVWRLMRLFRDRGLTFTCYAVAMALQRTPQVAQALIAEGHEIASHGWRWINYHGVDRGTERADMQRSVQVIEALAGTRPVGWYCGRPSENTLSLVAEEGGFLYHSDSYADDLPYWQCVDGTPLLVLPYTLDINDMKFAGYQGFNAGDQFFTYLKDSFDCLYAEGATTPRMMNVGLHCRIAGRPGRAMALARFLDYVASKPGVWICRRDQIARHWRTIHPFSPDDSTGQT
ncbi:MAG: allantoinase PuuE [Qingshengfaniella sp.]